MAKFPYPLNTSSADVQTNSVYDTDVAQWMQKVQNYVQTPEGVWVPQKCDSEGSALVQLSGRIVEERAIGNPGTVLTDTESKS